MADSNVTSAATATEPKAKNWLPTRYCDAMAKLVESDLVDVFEALGDVASRPCTRQLWSWDGNWYTPAGTRAAERPHMVALDEHSQVLLVLIRMAPFGFYTSAQRLMDLLWCMNICYRIFPPCQLAPCLRQRVWSAACQWQVMCKHCVVLFKSKIYLGSRRPLMD